MIGHASFEDRRSNLGGPVIEGSKSPIEGSMPADRRLDACRSNLGGSAIEASMPTDRRPDVRRSKVRWSAIEASKLVIEGSMPADRRFDACRSKVGGPVIEPSWFADRRLVVRF
jgi:hypothetical protein